MGSYASGQRLVNAQMQRVMCDLVNASWGLGSRTLADIFDPDMSKAEVKRHSSVQRESASAQMASQLLQLSFDMDATEFIAQVVSPALVIHRQKDLAIPFEAGRELASQLPDARLVPLPGRTHAPWMGDVSELLQVVLDFLLPDAEVARTNDLLAQQFARRGDVWELTFAGKTVHLKDSRGLNDLQQLLKSPGQELHVNTLAGELDKSLMQERAVETLDQQALADYKKRLAEIDTELEQNGVEYTVERQQQLLEERDALLQQLREGVGLAGRKRSLNDPTERNRKAVSARIKSSIGKISECHGELGKHLKNSVSTGTFCCYSPTETQQWRLSP